MSIIVFSLAVVADEGAAGVAVMLTCLFQAIVIMHAIVFAAAAF